MKVRPHAVHLIHETNSGNAVLIGLPPYRFRLRFNPTNRVEYRNGTIQHAERAFHFSRKINMTRRIDNVDPVISPIAGRSRRSDRDAPLLLLGHPVHHRGTVVYLSDLVGNPCVKKHSLGRGCLTGIDVGHDANIPRSFEWHLSRRHPTRARRLTPRATGVHARRRDV